MAGEKRAMNSSTNVKRKRKKKVVEYDIDEEDRISLLPDEILASILTPLPIIQVARTSVLSKRWRFVWTTVPHIVLDDTRAIERYEDDIFGKIELDEWMSIVLDILRARRSPLRSCHFKIDFFDARKFSFYRAFRLLRKHKLQELLLLNFEHDPTNSKVPPGTFLLSQSLQKLDIVNCNVVLPPQFDGFINLRTLCLSGVIVTEESFEPLVSGCPALEDLQLRGLLKMRTVRIRAPKLQSIDIQMYRPFRFCLVDTPCLRNVKLSYSFDLSKGNLSTYKFYLDSPPRSISNLFDLNSRLFEEEDDKEKDEVGKLIEFLMNLSNIKSLSVRFCKDVFKYSMKWMLSDSLPAPLQLVHLKKLFMELKLDDAIVINLLLFLLRSSPNLQELDLQGSYKNKKEDPVEFDCWGTEAAPDCLVNHLTMVQIREVHLSSKNWIGFVRFILLNACLLKTMKLIYFTDDQLGEKVVDELLQLKRASPRVVLKVRHIKPCRFWDFD